MHELASKVTIDKTYCPRALGFRKPKIKFHYFFHIPICWLCWSIFLMPSWNRPVKMLLQDLIRKGPFLASLQDFARSCGILRVFAGILHKIPARFLQNSAESCKILQGCNKRTFSCKILQDAFLLGESAVTFFTDKRMHFCCSRSYLKFYFDKSVLSRMKNSVKQLGCVIEF